MDFNIYRKNKTRIEALFEDRRRLVNMRSAAFVLSDWQFNVVFGTEKERGFAGIKDAVISDLENRVAIIDAELSSYGFTFDGQQNLPLHQPKASDDCPIQSRPHEALVAGQKPIGGPKYFKL